MWIKLYLFGTFDQIPILYKEDKKKLRDGNVFFSYNEVDNYNRKYKEMENPCILDTDGGWCIWNFNVISSFRRGQCKKPCDAIL